MKTKKVTLHLKDGQVIEGRQHVHDDKSVDFRDMCGNRIGLDMIDDWEELA